MNFCKILPTDNHENNTFRAQFWNRKFDLEYHERKFRRTKIVMEQLFNRYFLDIDELTSDVFIICYSCSVVLSMPICLKISSYLWKLASLALS